MDLNTTLRRSYDTELLILRTLFALDPDTNIPISTNYVLTTDGIGGLVWLNPFTNLSTAGTGIGYLPSTINSLTSNLSTLSTAFSTFAIGLSSFSSLLGQAYISSGIYTPQLNSTVQGLGSIGYLSTSQLVSTVEGLGSSDYVSTSQLVSSIDWILDPSRYISSGNLISTTANILPLSQLTSTVRGLGSIGYVSTSQLISTTNGLSTTIFSTFYSTLVPQFITPLQLTSTLSSLGTVGYISSSQLVSTVNWLLDASRYVSTGALVSTVNGISTNLQTTFYIDNAGNINFYGGTAVFSTVNDVIFLSTFMFSSITYKGPRGTTGAVVTNTVDMIFSSATITLDPFSSVITNQSQVNLDFYPTYVFDNLNTGASAYKLINMSSFIAYSNTFLRPTAESYVFAQNKTANYGNIYNQPIKMQLNGSDFVNKYENPYILCHYLTGGYSVGLQAGFADSNVDIQFGSTNSLFLSVQNLP
jgi:hypothetical protein